MRTHAPTMRLRYPAKPPTTIFPISCDPDASATLCHGLTSVFVVPVVPEFPSIIEDASCPEFVEDCVAVAPLLANPMFVVSVPMAG